PPEKFYADSTGGKFEIEGTGFLIEPTVVQTCAHVIDQLERQRRKRGPRPYASAVQFFYADHSASDAWTSAVRLFDVIHTDARIDVAILRLRKAVEVLPVKLATEDYKPIAGEGIGLCGYAHGSDEGRQARPRWSIGPDGDHCSGITIRGRKARQDPPRSRDRTGGERLTDLPTS